MKKSHIRVRPETYAEDNSVHVNTVYGWMRDGVIPHLKINRLILIGWHFKRVEKKDAPRFLSCVPPPVFRIRRESEQ
jgi:hypothetical protein